MSEERNSDSGSPEEEAESPLLERLENAAVAQGNANDKLNSTNRAIATKKERIGRLQGEVRKDEGKLPGLMLAQQGADDVVNRLLVELEQEINLRVERVDASGPVVQGQKAKFRALYDTMPDGVKVSWDTGGCPIIKEVTDPPADPDTDTITVDTSAIAPGDYDISANLALVAASAETAIDSPAVSTRGELPSGAK